MHEYLMNTMLLTELNLEFLILKGGCKSWSECALVKITQCCKSPVASYLTEMITGWPSTTIAKTNLYISCTSTTAESRAKIWYQ